MNSAFFIGQIKSVGDFLEQKKLLKRRIYGKCNSISSEKYSPEFKKASRSDNYSELFRVAIENDDYDFILSDDSFFQFSIDNNGITEKLRYAFYPSIHVVQFEEYKSKYIRKWHYTWEELNELAEEIQEEYSQFISEEEPCKVTPLRYDYDESLYKEMVHSVSHIHFGLEENIRVPVNSKLSPMDFTKIVYQFYFFRQWEKEEDLENFYNGSEPLPKTVFSNKDQKIPFVRWIT